MKSHLRRQIKLEKALLTANVEETEALIELLYYATKENGAHCCRLLDISRPTWRKWVKETPTAWYWPMVLRAAIKHTLSSIIAQRRATSKKFQNDVLHQLAKIPHHKEFEDEIANMAYEITGAQAHLRELLMMKGRWWSEIQTAAHAGGYSKATLRKAAKALGVVKTQEGYGENKDSFWRLPNEDDED